MNKEKIGVIIQARVGSTRLTNKINLPFYNEDTILDIVIKKILYLKEKNIQIVLSTGSNKENGILKKYSDKYKIDFFQGSEINVLDRFIKTAEAYNFSHIIRVCSDNPFLEVEFIETLIKTYYKEKYDYYSYKDSNNIPAIRTHIGVFVEIVSLNSLKIQEENEHKISIIEHVTKYIYENPKKFNINLKEFPAYLKNKNFLRFTIDDKIDFDNLKSLYIYYLNSCLSETVKYLSSKEGENKKNKMMINIKKYSK
jgi:spore coat polysaccharide biosynthesis protein SpsF